MEKHLEHHSAAVLFDVHGSSCRARKPWCLKCLKSAASKVASSLGESVKFENIRYSNEMKYIAFTCSENQVLNGETVAISSI